MNLSQKDMTPKPLSLKQRTSSVDASRDATVNTWLSAIGLLKLREFLITVDHFSIWKRHLAWAIADGKELRDYMTQRYSSSMVFMSLLLSTELSVLFNSAVVTTDVRRALEEERYETVAFWVGIFIIVSAILSLLGLVATFTAWGMVSAVNEVNAHCVFRSSIGQYVAELPGNFIVGSIYTFSIWMILFFFLLLPVGFSSFLLLGITLGLFVHIITAFSAFGRIIMHSGAMGSNRIFDPVFESTLSPCSLHANLLAKARTTLSDGYSIRRQYAEKNSIFYDLTVLDKMKVRIRSPKGDQPEFACNDPGIDPDMGLGPQPRLRRAGSLVKFDDGFDTSGLVPEALRDHSSPLKDTVYAQTIQKTPIDNASERKPLIQSNDEILPPSPTNYHLGTRQSTAHQEDSLYFPDTEIGDRHAIFGKGEEAGRIPKGPWRANEQSSLLAFFDDSDYDSPPL